MARVPVLSSVPMFNISQKRSKLPASVPALATAPAVSIRQARLASSAQYIQIVLQIQNLLLSTETTFVPGNALAFRCHISTYAGITFTCTSTADRERNRIEVGQHCDASAAVHIGKMNSMPNRSPLRQRRRCSRSCMHPCAHRLGPLANHPLLILLQASCSRSIQLVPSRYLRNRNQMISPKVTTFTLHATLLVSFSWRAKLRRKTPVRPERNESRGLLALVSPKNLLHRTLQIVVSKRRKTPPK